ncbi:MAG: 50S ribosomal protein L13 [Parcubacteria group bacterium]|nr:50S ribosomal protein L13 [Parcubacteria group bacterium]
MNTTLERKTITLDATDKIVGRLASEIVRLLRGKNRVDYTPHIDMGHFVIVNNVSKMRTSGRKLEQKKYYRFTGYPGGIIEEHMDSLMEHNPKKVLEHAINTMLPKNKLKKIWLKRLTINK